MDDIIKRLRGSIPGDPDYKLKLISDAAAEIERLRALCNDLHHDATCAESFCRLCGEGIQGWEARRG